MDENGNPVRRRNLRPKDLAPVLPARPYPLDAEIPIPVFLPGRFKTGRQNKGKRKESFGKTRNGKKNNKKKKRKRKGLRIFLLILAILILAAIGLCIGAWYSIIKSAPTLNTSDIVPSNYTSIIYDDNGVEIDKIHGEENREYVTLDLIPQDLQNAVIAIEDERFYEHNGIDPKGIIRALIIDIKSGTSPREQARSPSSSSKTRCSPATRG